MSAAVKVKLIKKRKCGRKEEGAATVDRGEQSDWKNKDCQVYALCDAHKAAHPRFAGFLSDI